MRKHKHEDGSAESGTATMDRPAYDATCSHHGHEMAVADGRLVCPEPGCHVTMALPIDATPFRPLHEIQKQKGLNQPAQPMPFGDKQPAKHEGD